MKHSVSCSAEQRDCEHPLKRGCFYLFSFAFPNDTRKPCHKRHKPDAAGQVKVLPPLGTCCLYNFYKWGGGGNSCKPLIFSALYIVPVRVIFTFVYTSACKDSEFIRIRKTFLQLFSEGVSLMRPEHGFYHDAFRQRFQNLHIIHPQ